MVETSAIDAQLAKALRAIRAGEAVGWPEGVPTSSDALTAFWERVDFHGIAHLLHDHAALLESWPETMLARIAEEARLIGLWEATHSAVVGKLLGALEDAGVETVLMKGTALAYALYEEPAARRRGDSDLLVRPADLERTHAALQAQGWQRAEDPHGLICQEGWERDAGHFTHALDLHWEPSDRPVLQKVLVAGDFFAGKRPLPRLHPAAYGADLPLILVHETLNQKWHVVHGYLAEGGRVTGARRLIWSVDFDLLARRLEPSDWERLVRLCEENGIGALIAEALRGAAKDLATPLPTDHLEQLEAIPIDPDIAASFEATDSMEEFLLDLRTASSWRQRLGMIRTRGFPPRSHLVAKYPAQSGWPTALLQGRLLVETAGRVLKRSVSQ